MTDLNLCGDSQILLQIYSGAHIWGMATCSWTLEFLANREAEERERDKGGKKGLGFKPPGSHTQRGNPRLNKAHINILFYFQKVDFIKWWDLGLSTG